MPQLKTKKTASEKKSPTVQKVAKTDGKRGKKDKTETVLSNNTEEVVKSGDKGKSVRTSQIEAGERTLSDLYENGIVRYPEKPKEYDPRGIVQAYFLKLPDSVRITPSTPIGTPLWWARDFVYEGKRRVLILVAHKQPDNQHPYGYVEAVDEDNIRRAMFYDAVCLAITETAKKRKRQATQ